MRSVPLDRFIEDVTPRGVVLIEAKKRVMSARTLDEIEEAIEWAWVMLTSLERSGG